MKHIDNFDDLEKLITFKKEDNLFAMVQIIKRQKDHPEERIKETSINTYYIRSAEHLMKLKNEIIMLCNHYGARAYINISPKSISKLQGLVAQELVRKMNDNEIDNPEHVTKSVAGKMKSKDAWWVIDMDEDKYQYKSDVLNFLKANNVEFNIIQTANGLHFLARPFNRKLFGDMFPSIDLHINSMGTLLFF